MTDEELKQQKEIQFFAATITAWVNTAFELDRNLLTLSAGGLGLLVTLLSTTVGVKHACLLVLYIAAMLAFLICVVAVLSVFRRNQTALQNVAGGNDAPDSVLDVLDTLARASFGIGAILTTIIGISTAVLSHQTASEARMATERTTREGVVDQNKSLNNFGTLRPLAGSAPAQAPAATPVSAPSPAPAPVSQATSTGSGPDSGSK